MTFYLYPGEFLFETNEIIARIVFFLDLCNPPTLEVQTLGYPSTYNAVHNATEPKLYFKDVLYNKCKKVEIVGHRIHQPCILIIWLT